MNRAALDSERNAVITGLMSDNYSGGNSASPQSLGDKGAGSGRSDTSRDWEAENEEYFAHRVLPFIEAQLRSHKVSRSMAERLHRIVDRAVKRD